MASMSSMRMGGAAPRQAHLTAASVRFGTPIAAPGRRACARRPDGRVVRHAARPATHRPGSAATAAAAAACTRGDRGEQILHAEPRARRGTAVAPAGAVAEDAVTMQTAESFELRSAAAQVWHAMPAIARVHADMRPCGHASMRTCVHATTR
eukprot:364185-Chlamydomonas_euryale.AAC.2